MSHKATPELKLKRFLYMTNEDSFFVSGNPEVHNCYKIEKLTCASELLKEDQSNSNSLLTNLFTSAGSDTLISRKETLFFALARFATDENASANQRHDIYTLVLNLCKSNEDLFTFIKFLTKIKKPFCTGVQKIVTAYYTKQDPLDLVKCISDSGKYHGWSHKDCFKLIHWKSDNPVKEVIFKYVLYGDKKAAETAGDNADATKVLEYLQKVKEYRTCQDENKVAQFIHELNIKRVTQIPPKLIKSQMVWGALVSQLSLNDLILSLPKMYKMNFFKAGAVQTKVIDILSNNEVVQASQIHPVEVYIGLKNLEKGGKPKDPHLIKYLESKEDVEAKLLADPNYKKPNFAHQEPAKCTAVIAAVQKTLAASYANLQPVQRKIMITIDTNDRMNDPCLTTKNVTCLEAAAILALCLLKANKVVTIAVFHGNTVVPLSVEKYATIGNIIKKLKEAKNGVVMWSAPFDWALNANKAFDVFIHMGLRPNIIDLIKEDREKDKPKEAFSHYMKQMNLPLTRLIICHFGIHNAYFSGGATNILDICGFDKNVPNVIDAYCKCLF